MDADEQDQDGERTWRVRRVRTPSGGEVLAASLGDLGRVPPPERGRLMAGLAGAPAAFGFVADPEDRPPGLTLLGRLAHWRLRGRGPEERDGRLLKPAGEGLRAWERLSAGRYAVGPGGEGDWLVLPDASACGRLERGRLAGFAYADPAAAAELLRAAARLACSAGSALCAVLPEADAPLVRRGLLDAGLGSTALSLLGLGLAPGFDWVLW